MLTVGYALQTLTMASTAVALALAASSWVVFTVAATAAVSVTMTRPTQAVVTPALSRTPLELGAVNVLSGWITAAGGLVAPALAGLLVAVANPASVYFAAAGAVATATFLATGIPRAAHTESTATAAVRQSRVDQVPVAGTDLDRPAVNCPGEDALDTVENLLVGVVLVGRCRQLLPGRDENLED